MAYPNDIDIQSSTSNYLYDNIGNLVTDSSEHLHMYWNNYGKLDSTYNWNSGAALKFIYDPSGNRIEKRYYPVPSNRSKHTDTYYIRDAQGNILANYVWKDKDSLFLTELDIYGSSRLGIVNADTLVYLPIDPCPGCRTTPPSPLKDYWLGNKQYELTNHLGNVLVTITDKKIPVDKNNDPVADYYLPNIVSQNDYYPFGMPMPGRSWIPYECKSCSDLKTVYTSFVANNGNVTAQNIQAFTTYANNQLSITRTSTDYENELKKCKLIQSIINFTGTNTSLISVVPASLNLGTNNVSIEAWIYPISPMQNPYYVILSNMQVVNSKVRGVDMFIYQNKLYAGFYEGTPTGLAHIKTSNPIPVNQWVHVVCIKTSTVTGVTYAIYILMVFQLVLSITIQALQHLITSA